MNLYQILIPLKDNTQNSFSEYVFKKLENKLLDTFGGYTKGQTNTGAWKDDKGKIYFDETISYHVASNSIDTIKECLQELNFYFQQESYFISLVSNEVTFFVPNKQECVI